MVFSVVSLLTPHLGDESLGCDDCDASTGTGSTSSSFGNTRMVFMTNIKLANNAGAFLPL